MASALLASRNDPYWGEPKVYTRTNPSPNPKICPSPNPNPSFTQIPNGHDPAGQTQFQPMESDEPAVPPTAAAAASEDSSSLNRKPPDLGGRWDSRGYVTFNISAFSKQELKELKRRLISELELVRSVTSRIESREFQTSVRSGSFPAMAGSNALISRSGPNADVIGKRQASLAPAAAPELKKLHTAMMKNCGQILSKVMRQKGALWFNTPVDVVGMALHDYHQIIKNPMDLGTVKSKLRKGFYLAPLDFAADVRLTFNNALLYNPPGHAVHTFAGDLLRFFEGLFKVAYEKYEKQRGSILRREEEERQRHLNYPPISPPPVRTPKLVPPPNVQPQPTLLQQHPGMRTAKQLKPKSSVLNKRPMTMEEKQKLGAAIQDLPEDRMSEVLQIVSKRNETQQNGDEVEIDFELMDNETLWELDCYVANWSKMLSKMRRQQRQESAMAVDRNPNDPSAAPSAAPVSIPSDAGNKSPALVGDAPDAMAAKKARKGGDPVEEDVDIGDEMPGTHYPSVEIEKVEVGKESSSSGSDSSSSGDSDSSSSSGSESDDDDDNVKSPAGG